MSTAVLVSGGVDSSVALALLKQQGCKNLRAFYLKIWLEDELAYLGNCPWEEDLKYARAVCEHLDVPLEVISMQSAYQDRVVSYTLNELRAGRTPSPDIFCNQRIKFGAFWDAIDGRFERIASGHYATICRDKGVPRLVLAKDPVKDQTYFLSHLSQAQLERAVFPLGVYPKEQVRRLASEFNLPTAERPDSQGICFLGKIKYDEFVKVHLGSRPGKIVDFDSKKVLGEHQGYWFHTIGQRKGLGLSGGPWFVSGKNVDENIIYVMHQSRLNKADVYRFALENPNWLIAGTPDAGSYRFKLRHGPRITEGQLERDEGGNYLCRLNEPDRGVADGQFTVIYDQNHCLGGAMIRRLPDDD